MRWLAHRGGALNFRELGLKNPGQTYPVVVAIGADPATILGEVTPVPDSLSEYQFAGLLRGGRTLLVKALGSEPGVPASSTARATSTRQSPTCATRATHGAWWSRRRTSPSSTIFLATVKTASPSHPLNVAARLMAVSHG